MKSKRGGGNNNMNNNNNNLNNSDSGNFNMVVIIIIVVVILVVAAYFLYKYLNSYEATQSVTKTLVPYIQDAKEAKRFTNGSIPKSTQGNEYNYSVWIYVSDYTHRNGEDKCILYKGDVTNDVFNNATASLENPNRNGNPSLWLLKKNNTLRVQIALETEYDNIEACSIEGFTSHAGENNNSNSLRVKLHNCDIEHFPLQRWVCVNLSLSNNVVDIYLNGELVRSCMLNGAPLLNNSDLLVCPSGGFNGFLANLKVSDKALGTAEIKSVYRKGPTLKPGLVDNILGN
jgi:hypothetical protein